jgi:hypothetical protein
MALIFPVGRLASVVGVVANMIWIWPDMRSSMAGAEPRYGTCRIFTPARSRNSSPATCSIEPAPDEPKESLPGFFLR